MKAADIAHVLLKLQRDLVACQRQESGVLLDPMPFHRWESHITSLRLAVEALSGDPSRLLTDEQLIAALHTRDLLPELAALLEQQGGPRVG